MSPRQIESFRGRILVVPGGSGEEGLGLWGEGREGRCMTRY